MMDEAKRKRLEAAGWAIGTASDFLGGVDSVKGLLDELDLRLESINECSNEGAAGVRAQEVAERLRTAMEGMENVSLVKRVFQAERERDELKRRLETGHVHLCLCTAHKEGFGSAEDTRCLALRSITNRK